VNGRISQLLPGQIGGVVVDSSGATVAGATVTVVQPGTGLAFQATTSPNGEWIVSSVPGGILDIVARSLGFKPTRIGVNFDPSRPLRLNLKLEVASTTETVEVTSNASTRATSRDIEKDLKKQNLANEAGPSSNVLNLQQRVAGVLPIRIDVPRTGHSYAFVRPLVVNEETKVTFSYKKAGK
jgi:hypothetical protein